MSERRVTRGGRALRAYLDEQKLSVPAWCDAFNARRKEGARLLDRTVVMRIIKGERWSQIPVDTALLIQRATGGRVRVEMFGSETAASVG